MTNTIQKNRKASHSYLAAVIIFGLATPAMSLAAIAADTSIPSKELKASDPALKATAQAICEANCNDMVTCRESIAAADAFGTIWLQEGRQALKERAAQTDIAQLPRNTPPSQR
jgi:hypothetical protein